MIEYTSDMSSIIAYGMFVYCIILYILQQGQCEVSCSVESRQFIYEYI